MIRIPRALALLALLSIAGTGAAAHDHQAGNLTIGHPFSRATAPAAMAGAAYMTIDNAGAAGDRLLSAASPVAGRVELHTIVKDGDVMRMREVEGGIAVPAGGRATLQPGGFHVMLMELKAPLREGDRFPLRLTFEKAGIVEVEVAIEKAGAGAPMSGHKH